MRQVLTGVLVDQAKGRAIDAMVDSAKKDGQQGPNQSTQQQQQQKPGFWQRITNYFKTPPPPAPPPPPPPPPKKRERDPAGTW